MEKLAFCFNRNRDDFIRISSDLCENSAELAEISSKYNTAKVYEKFANFNIICIVLSGVMSDNITVNNKIMAAEFINGVSVERLDKFLFLTARVPKEAHDLKARILADWTKLLALVSEDFREQFNWLIGHGIEHSREWHEWICHIINNKKQFI